MTDTPAAPFQFNQQQAPGSVPVAGQASVEPPAPQPPLQNAEPAAQPAAQPPAQQPATQEPGQGTAQPAPEYITREEALRIAQEAVRQSQSHTDKVTAKIAKELTRLQQAGIQATPEQVQALIAQEGGSAQPSQPAPASPQSPAVTPAQAQPAQGSEQHDPITNAAVAMMTKAGIQIDEKDPEFSLIDQKTDNPADFLNSVFTAIQTKKARVQRDPSTRIPSLGGGSGAGSSGHSSMSGIDTLESYFNSH